MLLKTFGLEQRYDEIDAKPEGDEETGEGFEHGFASRVRQRMGVNRHGADQAEAEKGEEKVRHGVAPDDGARVALNDVRLRCRRRGCE